MMLRSAGLAAGLFLVAATQAGCGMTLGSIECTSDARIAFTDGPRTLATAGFAYFQGLDASAGGLLGAMHGIVAISVPPGTTVTAAGVSWTPGVEQAGTTQRFVVRSEVPSLCGSAATISWSVRVLPPIAITRLEVSPPMISTARDTAVELVAEFSGGTGALTSPFQAPLRSGEPVALGAVHAALAASVAVSNEAGDSLSRSVDLLAQDPPAIGGFAAYPVLLTAGDPLWLSWSLGGTVTGQTLDPGGIALDPAVLSHSVAAAASGVTYVLTARNDVGDVATASVSPEVVPLPVVDSFTATPASPVLGGTAQLVAAFSGGDGRLVPQQNGAMSLPILSGVPVEVGPLRGNVTYTVNVTSAAGRTVSRDLVVGLSGPGTWALLAGAAPAYGRTGHTATRLPDGRVLVAGGFTSFFGGQEFPSATELYDPAVGTISAGPALLHARAHHAAALLADGRVLLAGGSAVQGQPVDEAEVLDVTAGTATAAGSVGGAGWVPWLAALPGGVAMLHSESMYSASGAAVLRFDPGTGLLAPLTTVSGLGWVESFVMPDGRLLLLSGGRYGLTPSSLLDPGTGAVQDTGTTLQELVPFDAVQLQDGRVLALDAVFAELYEPASGAFSATGTPAQVSYGAHRGLALLADGRVLVVDGYGAELYDPATGEFAATGGPLGESVFTALPDGSVLGTGGAGERYRPP